MLFAGGRTHLQTYKLTNLQTYTQIFSQYSGISSHFFGRYKTKGTLLQELQPKYDTSWMEYWTGKILTSCHSKLRFGIYCLFLHLSWRNISRYFVLEKLSVFICGKSMIWCALQLKKYFKIFRFGKFCLFSFVRRVWFDALPVVDGLWGHKIWEHSWGSTK